MSQHARAAQESVNLLARGKVKSEATSGQFLAIKGSFPTETWQIAFATVTYRLRDGIFS